MSTLEPGFWIAATLKKDSAPLRVYVGEIQEIDDRGVRITLIDWMIGAPANWDLFVPWDSLESALVATPEHSVERFPDSAGKWQSRMSGEAEDEA